MKEMCLLVGLLGVASNPSPYFGALGLVVGAGAGCWVLGTGGVSFLALVLLLVYLGGMMVVFAYSAALVAEPYPEAWGSRGVLVYLSFYVVLVLVGGVLFDGLGVKMLKEWMWGGSVEIAGVANMYGLGGFMLMAGGWGLFLTLFVVLEVVRGQKSGSLRPV
uniref:NADH-ubiquinone oxidoreductase chain 6 n=1 Tax=Hoplobatrachus rugulosus TaxID=110072 RepID=K7N833_HOPRU|nr:NADH dehydrogenase subunit 6 [Hoplobatrachus rugulosus]ADG37216.1 NADH dehydrogenase subunit 6 [Hoplobatrachus rugulosus]AGE11479.1 NADH dehydrogenase subunit 6 [Hoplobatrachus rugulosus]